MSDLPKSPFYDQNFVQPDPLKHPKHISGPCEAAYARGCRCNGCRKAWAQGRRRREARQPSPLTVQVDRLNAELDAAEMNLHALREENAMLRARLDELEAAP